MPLIRLVQSWLFWIPSQIHWALAWGLVLVLLGVLPFVVL